MEVVENMEEDILGLFFASEVVDVVDDQNVDHLVEVDKVVLVVILDRVDKLVDELIGGHVKHRLFREKLFDLEPDGV